MKKLKVVIIGCGATGKYHAERLGAFDDTVVAGFYSRSYESAVRLASCHANGRAYCDLIEMLDTEKPDAAFVCVPPFAHGQIKKELCDRKIHFFVEKPLALDTQTASEINSAVQKSGVITSVGFRDRYINFMPRIKDILLNEKAALVNAAWTCSLPPAYWWRKRELSGGQIIEQSIHHLDMARYFFGEAQSVFCASGKGFMIDENSCDLDEASSAVITFENGTIMNLLTACFFTKDGAGWKNGMTIATPLTRIEYCSRSSVTITKRDSSFFYNRAADQGTAQNRAFADAVLRNDPSQILSSYEDALKSFALALACTESAKAGKPVVLK